MSTFQHRPQSSDLLMYSNRIITCNRVQLSFLALWPWQVRYVWTAWAHSELVYINMSLQSVSRSALTNNFPILWLKSHFTSHDIILNLRSCAIRCKNACCTLKCLSLVDTGMISNHYKQRELSYFVNRRHQNQSCKLLFISIIENLVIWSTCVEMSKLADLFPNSPMSLANCQPVASGKDAWWYQLFIDIVNPQWTAGTTDVREPSSFAKTDVVCFHADPYHVWNRTVLQQQQAGRQQRDTPSRPHHTRHKV